MQTTPVTQYVPEISFDAWKKWRDRDRPSAELDGVPSHFGLMGLYLLATAEVDEPSDASAQLVHLHPAVIYIGMSAHVDRRLERWHGAVGAYRRDTGDRMCRHLRYALWQSGWTNSRQREEFPVAWATVALYERALLLSFARAHGRLPLLNRM